MLKVEGIDHVSLEVVDPAKSGKWYGEVLGLERRFEEAWGDRPLVVGAGGTSLALFERPAAEGDSKATGLAHRSGHIAFRVDRENFEQAPAHLRKHGIEIRTADYGISRSVHFHDPDGYQLELTTYEIEGSESEVEEPG